MFRLGFIVLPLGGCLVVPAPSVEKIILYPLNCFCTFIKKLNGQIFNGSVSGLSALLHWSVYLPLYQNIGFHLLLASIQKCGWFLYVDFLSCCTDLSVLGVLFSNSFWFSTQSSMLPANRDRFVYSFPNCISFISFSYLITLARTTKTVFNRAVT